MRNGTHRQRYIASCLLGGRSRADNHVVQRIEDRKECSIALFLVKHALIYSPIEN